MPTVSEMPRSWVSYITISHEGRWSHHLLHASLVFRLFCVVILKEETNLQKMLLQYFMHWLIVQLHDDNKGILFCSAIQNRWPGGHKVIRYKQAQLERFAPSRRSHGLITRLTTYKDRDCECHTNPLLSCGSRAALSKYDSLSNYSDAHGAFIFSGLDSYFCSSSGGSGGSGGSSWPIQSRGLNMKLLCFWFGSSRTDIYYYSNV